MKTLESLLKSCKAHLHLGKLQENGITTVEEIAECEPKDLQDDLGITAATATEIVNQAKEAGLFDKRKAAVQGTWKAVEDTLASDATKLFYQHLFETYPQSKALFKDADMDKQAEKLYKTVSLAVDYLNNVEDLLPKLEELGKRHALEWSCKREHYDLVGECLIWTLKTGLGDAWTPEVADAWTWVYGVIAKTMADAGDDALFDKRKEIVQSTWKAVEDSLAANATKLFYKKLFEDYPDVIPLFAHADMEQQATKLYKTVGLAVKFLDDVDALIPELEEMGR